MLWISARTLRLDQCGAGLPDRSRESAQGRFCSDGEQQPELTQAQLTMKRAQVFAHREGSREVVWIVHVTFASATSLRNSDANSCWQCFYPPSRFAPRLGPAEHQETDAQIDLQHPRTHCNHYVRVQNGMTRQVAIDTKHLRMIKQCERMMEACQGRDNVTCRFLRGAFRFPSNGAVTSGGRSLVSHQMWCGTSERTPEAV